MNSTPHDKTLDAMLALMDRQIIDSDGRMVAKVDDLELAPTDDGSLAVTGILTGPGALGPRVGGAVGAIATATWARLAGRDPDNPPRIDMSLVSDIGTAITLDASREELDVDGFETWARERLIDAIPGASHADQRVPKRDRDTHAPTAPPSTPSQRHRLTELLDMATTLPDGRQGEHVLDVTLAARPSHGRRLVIRDLLLGKRAPGTLFGYHRHPHQGPWAVRSVVRATHRNLATIPWPGAEHVDWSNRVVRLPGNPSPSNTAEAANAGD